jgi:8-oxo-dGTP diphosphatase
MHYEYVLGFAFNPQRTHVMLMEKRRPKWQGGLINGIGGHIENHETPADAMRRESREETKIDFLEWKLFVQLRGRDIRGNNPSNTFQVHCYSDFSVNFRQVKTMTDERVIRFPLKQLMEPKNRVIPNLTWLIPMAMSFERGERCENFVVEEKYNYNFGELLENLKST